MTGSSFNLQFGGKRPKPYVTSLGPQGDDRNFHGQLCLLVWCTWRLDSTGAPLASSDQEGELTAHELEVLVGETIQGVELFEPGLDLQIQFSNNLKLRVFSDHLPGNPSFDGNWQIRVGDKSLGVGPGYNWTSNPTIAE